MIHKISNGIFKIEKLLAIILGVSMLFSLTSGVLYRYVLKSPLVWSDEVAIFSLVWLSFIGGSMSLKMQNSASITIVMDLIRGKLRQVLLIVGFVILLSFVGYILYLSIGWLSSPNIQIQKSTSMGMPMIYAYLSIPVSFFFMFIHLLDLLIQTFKNGGKFKDVGEEVHVS